jgi:hypothetical protein
MHITNINTANIFDEGAYYYDIFSPISLLEKIVGDEYKGITEMTFYNTDRMLEVRNIVENKTYYFRGLNNNILELLCKMPKLCKAIKAYCLSDKYFSCSAETHPTLTAALLGDNACS